MNEYYIFNVPFTPLHTLYVQVIVRITYFAFTKIILFFSAFQRKRFHIRCVWNHQIPHFRATKIFHKAFKSLFHKNWLLFVTILSNSQIPFINSCPRLLFSFTISVSVWVLFRNGITFVNSERLRMIVLNYLTSNKVLSFWSIVTIVG